MTLNVIPEVGVAAWPHYLVETTGELWCDIFPQHNPHNRSSCNGYNRDSLHYNHHNEMKLWNQAVSNKAQKWFVKERKA